MDNGTTLIQPSSRTSLPFRQVMAAIACLCALSTFAVADPPSSTSLPATSPTTAGPSRGGGAGPGFGIGTFKNTDVVQGDPGFPAKYSGPQSSQEGGPGPVETVSADLFAGVRLWPPAPGLHGRIDVARLWPEPNASRRGISQPPTPIKPAPRLPTISLHPIIYSSNHRPGRRTGGGARRSTHIGGRTGHLAADLDLRPVQPHGHLRPQHLRVQPTDPVYELGGGSQPRMGLLRRTPSDTPPDWPWN